MEDLDRKFFVRAISRSSGLVHTHTDGLFFKAADPAFLAILREYPQACVDAGCDERQVEAAELLVERVAAYQTEHGTKVPDVNPGEEAARLLAPNE